MNYGNRWHLRLLLCTLPLAGCDTKSKEIGATAGAEGTSTGGDEGTSGGVDPTEESSGGETTGISVQPCESAPDEATCNAADFGVDSLIQCAWVETVASDASCSLDSEPSGRCISTEYQGEGCALSPCVGSTSVFRQDLGDGTFEWFTSESLCEYQPVGYQQCLYDGDTETAPGCNCVCEGLGGEVPQSACDPLGEACPNFDGTSQECEPTAANDSWECIPQYAGTSPMYGDECWPEDSPAVACTGPTICLPAAGLGVAGCDGGEGGGCCTELCDLSLDGPITCPDEGQICAPFYGEEQPPEGYEHVGVCRLP